MPKMIVTSRDTAFINVVATIFHKTNALLCESCIGKNVRVKCIINCRVKSKDAKVGGKDKEVNEVRLSELVNRKLVIMLLRLLQKNHMLMS